MKPLNTVLMILILGAVSLPHTALTQERSSRIDTVAIQTSAICGMCKERIEGDLAFERGVRKVELDDETKIVTIEYRTRRTDADKLRKAISKLGYDADDVAADQEAHDRLPDCCQKGNEPH